MITHLSTTLEKIARIITNQYGVNVVFQGSGAKTDGKTIFLPSLPPEGVSAEFAKELHGYLDHEAAHCIFTDFTAWEAVFVKKHKTSSEFHKWMSNHCEDERIEILMILKYPGCRLHLFPLNAKWVKITHDTWDKVSFMNRVCLGVRSIMAGKAPRLDADTKPLFTKKIIKLAKSLSQAKDTEKIIKICGKILKALDLEQEKQEQQENQQEDDTENSDEDKNGESSEEETAEKDGDNTDSESDEDGEGNGDSSDSEDEKDDEEFDGKFKSKKLNKDQKDAKPEDCQDVHSYMDVQIEQTIEKEQEKEEQASEIQKPEDREFNDARRHIPYTTRFDEVVDHTKTPNSGYLRIKQKVMASANRLAVELERLFKTKEEERIILERERGRISTRSLARLTVDPSYQTPFKERVKEETKNVAVQLVVDLSGSMSGTPVAVAKDAVAAMAEALLKLEIDFEVVGFNTGMTHKLRSAQSEDLSRFNRVEVTLVHHIFKSFDSRNLSPIASMTPSGANCDGESIRFFAKRLEQQKHKRKIMMVFSDGLPSCGGNSQILNSDLKRAVKEITAAGIECVGIGICHDGPKHFYPDFVIIKSLSELTKEALKKLKTILAV